MSLSDKEKIWCQLLVQQGLASRNLFECSKSRVQPSHRCPRSHERMSIKSSYAVLLPSRKSISHASTRPPLLGGKKERSLYATTLPSSISAPDRLAVHYAHRELALPSLWPTNIIPKIQKAKKRKIGPDRL
jgi:hypothetical protein